MLTGCAFFDYASDTHGRPCPHTPDHCHVPRRHGPKTRHSSSVNKLLWALILYFLIVGADATRIFQCSDFTCCGLSLRDLHSLVDHFEEAHVVVFDSAGNAVYPNPSPILRVLDHENEGPYMSFVWGYPAPRAPVAFLDAESCFESASDWSSPSEPISPVETSSEEQNSFGKVKSKTVRTGKRVHRPRQRKKDKTYNCPVSTFDYAHQLALLISAD